MDIFSPEGTMKARIALTTILALAAVSVAACDDDDDPTGGGTVTQNFSATLTGDAERPDPVSTAATGSDGLTATITGGTGGAVTITYSVTVDGLSGGASAAHIHGPATVDAAADIIVPLTVTGTGTSGAIITGSFTTTGNPNVSMDSLLVLMRNGNSYVNVHTTQNPGGEIRGQIIR